MLELRPICENCGKQLPNTSTEAMICTFECTYCKDCVENVLHNVCPNCGGGFEKRPSEKLLNSPAKTEKYLNPVDMTRMKRNERNLKTLNQRTGSFVMTCRD